MGTPLSYAAGGAASGLEELLKQRFFEQFQKMKLADDVERTRIAKQSADDNSEYRRMQQASLDDARASAAEAKREVEGLHTASNLPPGTKVDAPTRQALIDAHLGQLIEHKDATLGSTNLSGVASSAGAAPKILRLMKTANPGQDASDTFTGTASQMAGEQARKDAIEAREQARQDRDDAATRAKTDREDLVRLTASLRPPAQTPLVMVQTVDENGNPVTKMVKKEAGAEYVKPANATTANRVSSAEAVNKVGNDIMAKLADPKFASVVGPALGRASSLQDFIGNPPPEFAELAGEIESYALANMGVHGMRSAQGAEHIKALLNGRHTTKSLIASIKGLQNFSNTFVAGNKPKSGGGPASGSGSAPASASRVRYDMNGNPIKN